MKFQNDFEKAFKKMADDAQKQIDDAIEQGIEDGAKGGARRLQSVMRRVGGGIRKGYDSLGGARGIGGSILGLGIAGLLDSINRADQGGELIGGLLGESTAQQQLSTARAAGMSGAEFAQTSITFARAGLEQQDINDIVFDINERTAMARADGQGILSQFTGLRGQELINNVLAGISGLDEQDQNFALAELGFGGEVGQKLLSVLDEASQEGTLSPKETLQRLNEMNQSEGERLAKSLEEEARLAKEYRDKDLEFQQTWREKFLDNIDSSKIETLFGEREREAKSQASLIENFNENAKLATKSREQLAGAMKVLNENTLKLAGAIEDIAEWFGRRNEREDNIAATKESIEKVEPKSAIEAFGKREYERSQNPFMGNKL